MKKKILTTKTFVAIGLGAALFTILHAYVKIPSPIPNTSIQAAYAISAFFGALFGPIAGGLSAFIGHALSDALQYGSIWWSWVIASGISGLILGFYYYRNDVENGRFNKADMIKFNLYQVVANFVSFGLIAPGLDILIYGEPTNYAFTQGIVAAFSNTIVVGVVGTLLLIVYSQTRTKEGSLRKE